MYVLNSIDTVLLHEPDIALRPLQAFSVLSVQSVGKITKHAAVV
jgi:hypothetical protein